MSDDVIQKKFRQMALRVFSVHPGWYTVFAALMLSLIGFAAIDTVRPAEAHKQLTRLLPVALVAMTFCFIPTPRTIGYGSGFLYAGTLVLLVFLLAPGVPNSIVPVRNGARSWIVTPVMNIQPSELTKISFVLLLGWFLRDRDSFRKLKGLLIPFAMMCVPLALILKQPDLGTALIFPPALFAILVAAGGKMRHLISMLVLVVLAMTFVISVIAYDPPHERGQNAKLPDWCHILAGHQERRIAALMWPEEYERRDAFQQQAAIKIIGSAGLTGHGKQRTNILVRKAAALPEPHNDMIYAVIVGRWGVLGGLAVVGLYGVLVASMLLVAARTKNPFARLACVGFGGMMLAQSSINIAMNIGLMPITGITLPFVSYGGSSLLTSFMMVGLVLNFATRRDRALTPDSFEWEQK